MQNVFIAVSVILLLILIGVLLNKKKEERNNREQKTELYERIYQLEDSYQNTKADLNERLKTREAELNNSIHRLQKENESLQSELHFEQSNCNRLEAELKSHKENLSLVLKSNLASVPWLAGMMADYITIDIELEAKKLDWGHDVKREKKVASIREIRAEAKRRIEAAKIAVYQLEYLRTLVPGIDDLLATEYEELHFDGTIPDHDPILDYLSSDEWQRLSENEKNQLALDRYIAARKTNWQIGRDYELSVAYEYSQKGYSVDTFGSYMGLEDLGRDLIAKNASQVIIIQCKYWSKHKQIHEKHIYQLYGTSVGYCIENGIPVSSIHPVFVTNTELSPMAREVAQCLGVTYVEQHEMINFPRIKCNIGKDEYGYSTKIYHLPMDRQYDITKIEKQGEFYAFTVEEAVRAGFRRAFKWHGNAE